MQRILTWTTLAAMLALPACVTINVYFPEAAAEKAAEQFVDKVIGSQGAEPPAEPASVQPGHSPGAMLLDLVIPSAHAQAVDINVRTPQIQAIQSRMQQRHATTLSGFYASGAIGFARDGLVAARDVASLPLADRAAVNAAVADENRDRQAVYREIAVANGHPEWEKQIRETFAKQWIQQARPGWYYQDSTGAWQQK